MVCGYEDVSDRKIGMYLSSMKCMCARIKWDTLIHEIKARNSWESPITRDYLVGSPYHKGLLMSHSDIPTVFKVAIYGMI